MIIYIRKVNRNEWPDNLRKVNLFNKKTELKGDGLTRDLKTEDNALSFWKFEIDSIKKVQGKLRIFPIETENEIIVTLGLIGSNFSTTRCLFFTEKDLKKYNIKNKELNGRTLYKKGKKYHHDVEDINYFYLGDLAQKVVNKIINNQIIVYMRAEVIQKTIAFCLLNKIEINDLIIPMDKEIYDSSCKKVVYKGDFYEQIQKKMSSDKYVKDVEEYINQVYA